LLAISSGFGFGGGGGCERFLGVGDVAVVGMFVLAAAGGFVVGSDGGVGELAFRFFGVKGGGGFFFGLLGGGGFLPTNDLV